MKVGRNVIGPDSRSLMVVVQGFIDPLIADQSCADLAIGIRVVGLRLRHLAVEGRRLVALAATHQGVAKVDVGVHEVGLDLECQPVAGQGLVELSARAESYAEVAVGLSVAGRDLQRLPAMCDRFVVASLVVQEDTKIVFGNAIVRRAIQSAGPQGLAVAPKGRLPPRASHQGRQRQRGSHSARPGTAGPVSNQAFCRPRQGNYQADLRQVRVAVGVRLQPHLDHPDHGQQHAHVPEPAHQQVRTPPPQGHDDSTDRRQNQQRRRNLPRRQIEARMRIQHRQAGRPKRLRQVNNIGYDGIAQPPSQRHLFRRRNRVTLGPKRHRTRCRRQHQQGELFEDQSPLSEEHP